jgi:hypothetical protein
MKKALARKLFQYWVFDWHGTFYCSLELSSDEAFEKWKNEVDKPGLKTLHFMAFTNNPQSICARAETQAEAVQKAAIEPFERSIRGLTNILDIIFSHEAGQHRITLSLDDSPNVFLGKAFFESRLKWLWVVANSLREPCAEIKHVPTLMKISCKVIEPTHTMPDWFNEWDGKFYYNQ